jgi:hypothetical protein
VKGETVELAETCQQVLVLVHYLAGKRLETDFGILKAKTALIG